MQDARPPAALVINELTLTLPNGRRLLENARLSVARGEFMVLVGPSGSGKSTLLRLIAGLEPADAQRVAVEGELVVGAIDRETDTHDVGIVFQNHALFDELSAVQNVQFALDHSEHPAESTKAGATAWLERMHVPTDVPLSRLSGGERQRVALARTMARNPALLLFDEPTTGLDPFRASAVADMIVRTNRELGKTVVVVTHDYEPFLKHSPKLVLLDPHSRSLREVQADELRRFFAEPVRAPSRSQPSIDEKKRDSIWLRWFDAPGETGLVLLTGLLFAARGWKNTAWKLRYLLHYFRMTLLGSMAVYVAIAGIMLGFVSVTFTFRQLPYSHVTLPLLTDEFLAATGYSAFRVVVPLLIGVLMAGRCGAALAADVGARRLTHQFEAMRSLGARSENYLLGNMMIALFVAGPVLTLIGFASSTLASLTAYLLSVEQGSPKFFWRNYFATVWPAHLTLPRGTWWVLAKASIGGVMVAALSYQIGGYQKSSSVEVSRDVGRTIFWTSLAVLFLHSLFSFIEF